MGCSIEDIPTLQSLSATGSDSSSNKEGSAWWSGCDGGAMARANLNRWQCCLLIFQVLERQRKDWRHVIEVTETACSKDLNTRCVIMVDGSLLGTGLKGTNDQDSKMIFGNASGRSINKLDVSSMVFSNRIPCFERRSGFALPEPQTNKVRIAPGKAVMSHGMMILTLLCSEEKHRTTATEKPWMGWGDPSPFEDILKPGYFLLCHQFAAARVPATYCRPGNRIKVASRSGRLSLIFSDSWSSEDTSISCWADVQNVKDFWINVCRWKLLWLLNLAGATGIQKESNYRLGKIANALEFMMVCREI